MGKMPKIPLDGLRVVVKSECMDAFCAANSEINANGPLEVIRDNCGRSSPSSRPTTRMIGVKDGSGIEGSSTIESFNYHPPILSKT